jgi:hypothetical protein
LFFCVDGLASYLTTIKRVFREKLPRHSERGRCMFFEWPRLHLAQVFKQYEKGRVVDVVRRIYQGSSVVIATIIKSTQGTDVSPQESRFIPGVCLMGREPLSLKQLKII